MENQIMNMRIDMEMMKRRIDQLEGRLAAYQKQHAATDKKLAMKENTNCANTKAQDEGGKLRKDKEMLRKYASGLTMHGLAYIYHGNRFERVIWIFIVMSAMAILVYGFYSLIQKYAEYNVTEASKTYFPTYMELPTILLCSLYSLPSSKLGRPINTGEIFNLTSCSFADPTPINPTFYNCSIEATSIQNGTCLVINENQDTVQNDPLYEGRIRYVIKILNTLHRYYKLLLVAKNEVPIFISRASGLNKMLEIGGSYEIEIRDQTTYFGLPSPYKSDCIPGKNGHEDLSFYDKYQCLRTCVPVQQYRECGGADRYWVKLIPEKIRNKFNFKNVTQEQIDSCMERQGLSLIHLCPDCPIVCEHTTYNLEQLIEDTIRPYVPDEIHLSIWFRHFQKEVITHTPAYSGFSFMAEMGGYLGLLTGCSAISIIELAIVIVLFVKTRF